MLTLGLHLRRTGVGTSSGSVRTTLTEAAGGAALASAETPVRADGADPLEPARIWAARLDAYLTEPPPPGDLARLGSALGALLFPPPVAGALAARLSAAPRHEFCLAVHAEGDRSLASLPFEFALPGSGLAASDEMAGAGPPARRAGTAGAAVPLALHPRLHLVRAVQVGSRGDVAAGGAADPDGGGAGAGLRVLVATALPEGVARYPHLSHAEGEAASIIAALGAAPETRRCVRVEALAHATPAALERALAASRPHVLHYIGHGDRRPTGPFLALEGGHAGTFGAVYAEDLARLLRAAPPAGRLVVLSCCGGGRAGHDFAATLLGTGAASAAVVMQMPLRDIAARLLARAFYAALGEGQGVTAALWQARQAVQGVGPDWGVPVLYRGCRGEVGLRPDDVLVRADSPPSPPEPPLPPSPAPAAPGGGIPPLERPFVCRADVVSDLEERLSAAGAERLVTVTGVGGMGKTTLAAHVASRLRARGPGAFPGGVAFVECDALRTRDELLGAIRRQALGGTPSPSAGGGAEALGDALRDRVERGGAVLLVLDCFEGLAATEAGVVRALLRRGGEGLRLLVTSRVVLGLPEEYELHLRPLRIDPGGAAAEGADVAAPPAGEPESHALFREAVRQVAPDVARTLDDGPARRGLVADICARLEGVPLALLLAANRLRYLSLEEVRDHVAAHPLDVLKRRAAGGVVDRHADMGDVIDASVRLLPEEARRLLPLLSLFAGSFAYEDARAVCGAGGSGTGFRLDLLDGLETLRAHSLLQVHRAAVGEAPSPPPHTAATRYKLFDTVREYLRASEGGGPATAGNVGDGGLLAAARLRHAEHYAARAGAINALLGRGEWDRAVRELWAEVGNLREAVGFARKAAAGVTDAAGGAEAGGALLTRLAASLGRIYFELGLWNDFAELLSAADEALARRPDPATEALLLGLRGALARRRGEEHAARALWERRLELCTAAGRVEEAADTLFDLASQAQDLGQMAAARALLARALRLARTGGDHDAMACARVLQARLLLDGGDVGGARRRAEDALALLRRGEGRDGSGGNLDTRLFALPRAGAVLHAVGASDAAEAALARSLRLAARHDRPFNVARALAELAAVWEAAGRPASAGRALLLAATIHAELGSRLREKAAAERDAFWARHPALAAARGADNVPWREALVAVLHADLPAP